MSNKRAPGRSLDEWMELVTECRQSGLTDAACTSHYLRSVRGDSFTTHFFGKIQYVGIK